VQDETPKANARSRPSRTKLKLCFKGIFSNQVLFASEAATLRHFTTGKRGSHLPCERRGPSCCHSNRLSTPLSADAIAVPQNFA
jgi:hypothetical protein